jgi:hypothetical protein
MPVWDSSGESRINYLEHIPGSAAENDHDRSDQGDLRRTEAASDPAMMDNYFSAMEPIR